MKGRRRTFDPGEHPFRTSVILSEKAKIIVDKLKSARIVDSTSEAISKIVVHWAEDTKEGRDMMEHALERKDLIKKIWGLPSVDDKENFNQEMIKNGIP